MEKPRFRLYWHTNVNGNPVVSMWLLSEDKKTADHEIDLEWGNSKFECIVKLIRYMWCFYGFRGLWHFTQIRSIINEEVSK